MDKNDADENAVQLPLAAVDTTRERAQFCWCVKHDCLCPAPSMLKGDSGYGLEVIEGVCRLFDDYGIVLPAAVPSCKHDQGETTPMAAARLQVLGPALAGLQHDSNPNLLLVECSGSVRAVATRPIAKGEVLCCDFLGHCRLPRNAYVLRPGGTCASDSQKRDPATRELMALVNMIDNAWPSADQRCQLNTIVQCAADTCGSLWVEYAARSLLLRSGVDCESHARELHSWLVTQVGIAPLCASAYLMGLLCSNNTAVGPNDACVRYLCEASQKQVGTAGCDADQ